MIIIGEIKHLSGIYLITNTVNKKIYVGSSIDSYKRYVKHKSDLNKGQHHSPYLQNSWNKYGEDSFTFEIIELVTDKNKLIEREQYWIDLLNVCDKNIGYNINTVAGSSFGNKHSDEVKERMMLSKHNNRPVLQFDINGNLIKEWYSAKQISRELNINKRTVVDRIKNKTKFNDYYLIYLDEFSEELLKKVLSEGKVKGKKKINQYDSNGFLVKTWDSIRLAAKTLNIDKNNIILCCQGKRKTSRGFIWSYAD